MQVGRTLWLSLAFRPESARHARNMLRIAIWFMASAGLWLAGAVMPDGQRIGWWLAALALEYAGPFAFFRVPGLGHSTAGDWDISPSHMAERCGLFIIIALGEGIVVIGSSVAHGGLSAGLIGAMALAFTGSALMWWLYFDLGADRGQRFMSAHDQPGRIARNAYTYLHMPIVAGVILAAVGDSLLIEHWDEPALTSLIAMQCGGTMLFLAAMGLFKRYSSPRGNFPMSHTVAFAALALLGGIGLWLGIRALDLAAGVALVLLLACVWEWGSFHGGWLERYRALRQA